MEFVDDMTQYTDGATLPKTYLFFGQKMSDLSGVLNKELWLLIWLRWNWNLQRMIRKLLQLPQRIETMYDLKSITEEQYAMMELMNNGYIHPKGETRDYVTEAIACGQEAFEQYKDADIMAN